MKEYSLNEIRKMFLDFFESKDHLKMESFSLVPHKDKSLLLINSGMAPLKPYFTGEETPPRKRVTTCQKCIRTPDIENVGKTARHGTFFEMLGNFSFGDYFKEAAIQYAWEFLTKVVGISEENLYVSVYEEDDESKELWKKLIGLSEDRIFKMGKEDNFWEIGVGPCGPCSEIYVDRGEKYGCGSPTCQVGCECDRYVEIWNLVFTQFDRDEKGNYNKLDNPNIDTGMGLERLSAYLQGVDTIFEVDTIKYVLDYICSLANIKYKEDEKKDISVRVITDHIRSVVFMASDGVLPSNEGRGYVLKRLFRRAIRHGKLLGIKDDFMVDVAKKAIEVSYKAYPNLIEKQEAILKILEIEEKKFNETINQGLSILKDICDLNDGHELSGEDAFKLYDTYGFPLELTSEILAERGFKVDIAAFEKAMNRQKEQARNARGSKDVTAFKDDLVPLLLKIPPTNFVGYNNLQINSNLLSIIEKGDSVKEIEGEKEAYLVFEDTPFYATSGGQAHDIGVITTNNFKGKVIDVIKTGDKFLHKVIIEKGIVKVGDECTLIVDEEKRNDTIKNHTATHLLHKALKEVLGEHVNQAGSSVDSERLRFDFSHYEKLTREELGLIQNKVNRMILKGLDIEIFETDINKARELGASALFGEKYGNIVRVVKIGDFSVELCGGVHVKNTSFINVFEIISQSSVGSGVRRIEAITGKAAIYTLNMEMHKLTRIADTLKVNRDNVMEKVSSLIETNKQLQKEIEKLKSGESKDILNELINNKSVINNKNVIIGRVDDVDVNTLREFCDKIKDKLSSAVVILGSVKDAKATLIASTSKDYVAEGVNCGKLVKEVAISVGSGGGGRPDMAQAGIKDISRIDEALENSIKVLEGML